jgi:hypothetical protein
MVAFRRCLVVAVLLGTMSVTLAVFPGTALAQFGPPMTLFGSVTDAAGPVAADLPVQVYVGDKVCGTGKTQLTGDGDARVTVYFADVVSREQTAGCGVADTEVRVKIGDRFATQTGRWKPGPVEVDVVFGNATPKPIPTFTPTPRPTSAATGQAQGQATPTPQNPVGTATTATGGSTPDDGTASATALTSATGTVGTQSATATATLKGGVVTSGSGTTNGTGGGGGGGFPVWAGIAIGLGAVALIGGGAGIYMARMRHTPAADHDPDLPQAASFDD